MVITLRRSRLLDFSLVSIHALGALALFFVSLPAPIRLVALVFVVLSLARALRRETFSRLALSAENANEICFWGDSPQAVVATILPETSVFLFLVVLHLLEEEGQVRRQRVLLPDQMRADEFRRLRVWLRWRLTSETNGRAGSLNS
ncbi:protein YgfX [uncultured Propionivibrio sp.]|uniref:protein YgfX n=1 Tax=uncultured Propionivibrio sp. TaxID=426737 RepID=UPI0029C097AA|nr:protein YgfX [uncultured Propionivibrio sp.]